MVTRKDVAKKAGVSTATVSRVVNNYKHVKPEVRQRVLKVIEELDYRPSILAKSLKVNKSYAVAFLVPDITNPYYTEIYKGINKSAAEEGYLTFLYEAEEKNYIETLLDRRVDGIITGVPLSEDGMDFVNKQSIPVVYLGIKQGIQKSVCIKVDFNKAVSKLMDYLYELGHRKIGIITRRDIYGRERYEGYKKALLKLGLQYNSDYVEFFDQGYYTYTRGYDSMVRMLARNADITALVANNDLVAIGAMTAAREKGLAIPEDISFVGFDDSIVAMYSEPPLTTIKILKHGQGNMAFKALMNLIKGGQTQVMELESELIIRDSVKKCL